MHWLDLTILIIWGLSTINGYLKGFILTLFSLGSYILAFYASKIYYPLLAGWIKNTPQIFSLMEKFFKERLDYLFPEIMDSKGAKPVFLPSFLENYGNQAMELAKESFAKLILDFVINLISMVLLFFLARALILILGHLISKIFKAPGLKGVNRVGGGLVGFVRGLILISLAILIMIPIATINLEGTIARAMQESIISPFLSKQLLFYLTKWL